MAKKKEEEAPAGSPAWMATFSDLMNLLLCFFVLLFSMSSVDAAKYDQVVQSLSAAFSIINTSGGVSITQGQLISSGLSQLPEFSNFFGDTMSNGKNTKEGAGEEGTGTMGEDESEEHGSTQFAEEGLSVDATMTEGATSQEDITGGDTSQQNLSNGASSDEEVSTEEAVASYRQQELSESERMAQQIEALATQYGIQDLVQVDFNGQYVRITLNGALLFDSGSATLTDDALPLVEKIAKIIEYYENSMTEIEGHTDNVPIHSSRFEDNDVLSMYRAKYVADYVREHSTVDPANIVSSGRGAYVPIADNSTAEGRARNRRVEVKIYNSFNSQGANGTEEEGMTPAEEAAPVENTTTEPAATQPATTTPTESTTTTEPVTTTEPPTTTTPATSESTTTTQPATTTVPAETNEGTTTQESDNAL